MIAARIGFSPFSLFDCNAKVQGFFFSLLGKPLSIITEVGKIFKNYGNGQNVLGVHVFV